ncbi:MAG: alpha/beta hydrolase [Pseudonocardia sp.]|nr:alpha/beta hydrolase [Pseudonocardia sp.]
METTEVGGLRVTYERAGAGPALVLLHGYVGDGQTTWRRQLDELSDDFTVVAWDAPGAGGSSDPPEDFGIAGYADCLAEFIDTLRLDGQNVVGLSFGGILALALHHRCPAVPKALVLASAYAGWRGSLPPDVAETRLRQALVLADLPPEEFVGTLLPTMFSPATAADAVAAFRTSMLAFHPVGFRAMARASAEDLRHVVPQVRIPTLLLYGEQDARAGPPMARDLEAAIDGARIVVLPEVGHVCNMEAPDAFNNAVRSFLHDTNS